MEHQLACNLSSGRELPTDASHYRVASIKCTIALIKHHGSHTEEFFICHIRKVCLRILHTLANGLSKRLLAKSQEGYQWLPNVGIGQTKSEH